MPYFRRDEKTIYTTHAARAQRFYIERTPRRLRLILENTGARGGRSLAVSGQPYLDSLGGDD